MTAALAPSILKALEQICGSHLSVATIDGSHDSLLGPVLGNVLVAGAASLVTIACFVAAGWMLVKPGEHDPSHPKYRVLSADR